MAASSFAHTHEAAEALRDAVAGSGPEILCDPLMLSSVLADLMPGATGAARMLVAAAEDRVIELMRDQVAQGISAETATRMVAASFARTSLYSPEACAWVVQAFAEADGLVSTPGQEPVEVGRAEEEPPEDEQSDVEHAEPPTKVTPVSEQETTKAAGDRAADQTETVVRPPVLTDTERDGLSKTKTGSRIRGRLAVGIGAVLVVAAGGTAAAVGLHHPSPPPPVIPPRPAGLNVVNFTYSSVVFGWSEPRGPRPTHYLIFEDGQPVGTLPAGTTSDTVSGLSPETSYNFQVEAVRGHQHSRESAVLPADTANPPPVSQANLAGSWTADYSHFTSDNLTPDVTSLNSDTWTITSECQSGSCSAHVSGSFQNTTLTMTLRPGHGGYSGKVTVKGGYIQCKETKLKEPNYLTFTLKPTAGSVVSDQWLASSFTGTFSDNVADWGGCEAGGFSGRIGGSS